MALKPLKDRIVAVVEKPLEKTNNEKNPNHIVYI